MIGRLLSEAHRAEIAEIRDVLSPLENCIVTTSSPDALTHISAGGCAVIIPAPEYKPVNDYAAEFTWTLWTLTASTDELEATESLAPVIGRLTHLMDAARPETFETSGGQIYNGFIISITSTYATKD